MTQGPSRRTVHRRAASAVAAVLALALGLAAAPRSDAADPAPAADQAVAQKSAALLHDPMTQALGNQAGDVVIVEFFDYACPFCKAAEPRLQELLRSDKGVKLIVKEFPILTPQSLVATKAALASVRQGKYAAFHQALMLYKGQLEEPVIFETAAKVGIDLNRLRRDMAAPEIADEVIANLNLARALRIFGTPTFIVGSHIVTESSATIDFPRTVAAARAAKG